MTKEKTKKFDVIFEGVARSSGKLRCDIDVDFVTTGESFSLATDEGKIHGGANTAPPPLALFTGCLLYTSPSPRDLSTSRMPSSA